MRKLFAFLFVFLVIAAGAGYLLYPTISDQIGQANDGAVMKAYREKTAAMTSEQIDALLAGAVAYNETLETIQASDPFSAGVPRTSRDYQNRLNVHSGVIGELVIPAIGVYLPVYHNSAETPATEKLVHLESSSLPSDRPGTSIILAGPGLKKAEGFLGNIGLTDERMLENLDRLTRGDLIILNVLDRTMVYRIGEGLEEKDAILMLSPGGLGELELGTGTQRPQETGPEDETVPETGPEAGQERTAETEQLTLLRPWKDQKLLVVRAERISISEARDIFSATDRATYPENWKNVLLLGSPVLLLGLLVMFVIERIKRRSYMLPGEGRQSARRERKTKAKLDNLTTESVRVKEHEEKDSENAEHDDRNGAAADEPSGHGGGKPA